MSGLNITHENIIYRDGTGALHQIPGKMNPSSITLRQGTLSGDSMVYEWINSISSNEINKQDITISLTDDTGDYLLTWNISNAFPQPPTAPAWTPPATRSRSRRSPS